MVRVFPGPLAQAGMDRAVGATEEANLAVLTETISRGLWKGHE